MGNTVAVEVANMLAAAWLMLSSLFYSLQLSSGSFPRPLTEEEERYYLDLAGKGDLEARNVLIERNLRLVAHIMKKYYAQTADQEDLISIGTIGLIKGITTFDASKGARLATYAARCVENAIHTSDFKSQHLAPQGFKRPAWRILDRLSGDLYVLSQTQNSIVRYAPLYIHSFVLCAPRKILEATQFNQRYRRYEEIDNVPDRLRWCRHSKGLMQVEVADKVGMTHSVYKAIEEGFTQHIEPDKVDRLAQFYGVPVTDFLDEFNHFLYDRQAVRIRAYRESFGMGKKPFARKMGIPVRCLQEWESGRKVISLKCWERHFKGRA